MAIIGGTRTIDLRAALEEMHARLQESPCALAGDTSSDGEIFVLLAGTREPPLLNQGGRIVIAIGYEKAQLKRLHERIGKMLGILPS